MSAACTLLAVALVASCSTPQQRGASITMTDAASDAMTCRLAPVTTDCGDVVTSIIHETCVGTICHHDGPTQAAHLDLLSSCVADRLVGVASTCHGRLLVDPARPGQSFLLEKLERDAPECGVRMPYENQLPPTELACMRDFIFAIAGLR